MLKVNSTGVASSTISSLDSGFVSYDASSLYTAYHDPGLLQLNNAKVSPTTTCWLEVTYTVNTTWLDLTPITLPITASNGEEILFMKMCENSLNHLECTGNSHNSTYRERLKSVNWFFTSEQAFTGLPVRPTKNGKTLKGRLVVVIEKGMDVKQNSQTDWSNMADIWSFQIYLTYKSLELWGHS